MGRRAQPGQRRLDRAADHAVPRGGRRAGRRDHRDRPRPGDRARHPRRAQAGRRRPDARRSARPTRPGSTTSSTLLARHRRRSARRSHGRGTLDRAGRRRRRAARRGRRGCAPPASPSPSSPCTCPASTRSSSPSPAAPRRSPHDRHRPQEALASSTDQAPVPRCPARARAGQAQPDQDVTRTPEALIDVTLQPIIFLVLFTYIFGGAIADGSQHDYLQFLLPGLLGQTIAMGGVAIGVNLNTDIEKGVFDRFRSLPIARSAPLVGAVLGRRRPLRAAVRRHARLRLRARLPHRDQPAAAARRARPVDRLRAVLRAGSRCSSA